MLWSHDKGHPRLDSAVADPSDLHLVGWSGLDDMYGSSVLRGWWRRENVHTSGPRAGLDGVVGLAALREVVARGSCWRFVSVVLGSVPIARLGWSIPPEEQRSRAGWRLLGIVRLGSGLGGLLGASVVGVVDTTAQP